MTKTVITKLWFWDQPPNCAVITLRQIIEDGAPVLLVTHDLDDHGWQFLSGQDIKSRTLWLSLSRKLRNAILRSLS